MVSMVSKDDFGYYNHNSFKGKVMGIFTSGGDSQGMNAAVRSSVRTALYLGIKIYIIREGYQGMIDGGDHLVEATWVSVSSIIHIGGTIIGSARSTDFREREGRLKAALNLVKKGINNLIVIGGDGSLTGANLFRQEWSNLLDELLISEKINAEERKQNEELLIVGIVGSIDNDFCGTDMTIGTDSALQRIMEAIEAIKSTAYSHQRAFIMEVMGRHCGYLGLSAALFCGADFLFIPEDPVSNDWKNQICDKLLKTRIKGQRLNIVIVAEGAIDENGTPISAEEIKDVITDRLKVDTRVTILGHVQRGGNPSAFDRILACRMGYEAVIALAEATSDTESMVVSLHKNDIIRISLMEGVQRTQGVAKAMAIKDFKTAIELRGRSFENNLHTYKFLTNFHSPEVEIDPITGKNITGYRFAIMHIGSPACGMNAATRSFVWRCLYRGFHAFGINDGIEGLVAGDINEMGWLSVRDWVGKGGSMLGTKNVLPEGKFKEIAERLREYQIQGILIIGGFDAYHACGQLADERCHYPEFRIPLVVIPATISNNVPGTEFSLGADTALNVITEICDRIRQSAQGTRRRVFIIETMGDRCGYLATLSALAGGADAAYIYEEKFTISDIQEDIKHMVNKMDAGVSRGLILRNERASTNYSTEFVHRAYSEEGKGKLTCKMNIIGHMQQGGSTTPFDRNLGTKMGAKCVQWFADQLKTHMKLDGTLNCIDSESACLLGVLQREYSFTPLQELLPETDFKLPKHQWWLKLRPLIKILAKHESAYENY